MAVKILIRRTVLESKAKQMIPLFRQMRKLANEQPGYITGETMRNLENPDEFLIQHHDPAVVALTGVQPQAHQLNLADDPAYAETLVQMKSLLPRPN